MVKSKDIWERKLKLEINFRKKKGLKLSNKDISQSLGCTETILVGYKLSRIITKARFEHDLESKEYFWGLVKKFVDEKQKKLKRFNLPEIYDYIGRSEKWMKKRFPDMVVWIKEQRKQTLKIVKEDFLNGLIIRAIEAVHILFSNNGKVEFKEVAKIMGIKPYLITFHKEVNKAILETKEKLIFGKGLK